MNADVIVLYCKTDPERGHRGISTLLIEKDCPGFSVGEKIDKLGCRGSPTNELIFEDCEVSEENLLGDLNKGVYILMSELDFERLTLTGGAIGIMEAAWNSIFEKFKKTDLSEEHLN